MSRLAAALRPARLSPPLRAVAVVTALVLAVPVGVRAVDDTAAEEPALFSVPLPVPEPLTDADITLTAAETDVQVLPGAPTRMWTYNGSFPGPLIRRPAGEETRITLVNDLPEAAGSLTLHHHGNHNAAEHDGQPDGADYVVEPGAQRTYVYELTEDGAPARARTQWYHDHSHFRTGRNVWRGLAGMFIVDDPAEDALGLPAGEHDIPLLVADRRFDADNQLTDPFTAPARPDTPTGAGHGAGWPPFDEVIGDRMLVNGAPEPYLEVEARRYRFRILNASNFRPINVALSTGQQLTQIATEGGLLPAPVRRDAILLGPAERAEVVVDFAGLRGNVTLQSVPVSGSTRPATAPAVAPIMQFRITGPPAEPDTSRVPSTLSTLPDWVAEASTTPDRAWTFGLNPSADEDGHSSWTINGRTFDHTRVDARPEVGDVETWLLANTTPIATSHYIHLHHSDWVLLSRNGQPPAPHEAGMKETFRLDPGEFVLVARRFNDHTGPFMLHCHMLEHEDHGMMATFEVVPEGQGDLLPVGDPFGAGGPPVPSVPGVPNPGELPELPDLPGLPGTSAFPVFANPNGSGLGYTPRAVVVPQGAEVELTNLDQTPHDLSAVDLAPDGRPLFRSRFASAFETVPVVGTDRLEPGTYRFLCSLHSTMQGDLVVLPTGERAAQTPPSAHHHEEHHP
jgi:spore coat protein A, manganese oxidase